MSTPLLISSTVISLTQILSPRPVIKGILCYLCLCSTASLQLCHASSGDKSAEVRLLTPSGTLATGANLEFTNAASYIAQNIIVNFFQWLSLGGRRICFKSRGRDGA